MRQLREIQRGQFMRYGRGRPNGNRFKARCGATILELATNAARPRPHAVVNRSRLVVGDQRQVEPRLKDTKP